MEKNLGNTLKELRKKENLTAKDVSAKLKDMGYAISDKTLSGYENGIRMPNADVFMALCQIYNCKNILQMFSFVKADYSIPTDDEWDIIEKYRILDRHGKEIIDFVLKKEAERMERLLTTSPSPAAEPISFPAHLVANAAHDDEGSTAEERQADDDMMMDDSEWE